MAVCQVQSHSRLIFCLIPAVPLLASLIFSDSEVSCLSGVCPHSPRPSHVPLLPLRLHLLLTQWRGAREEAPLCHGEMTLNLVHLSVYLCVHERVDAQAPSF